MSDHHIRLRKASCGNILKLHKFTTSHIFKTFPKTYKAFHMFYVQTFLWLRKIRPTLISVAQRPQLRCQNSGGTLRGDFFVFSFMYRLCQEECVMTGKTVAPLSCLLFFFFFFCCICCFRLDVIFGSDLLCSFFWDSLLARFNNIKSLKTIWIKK